jgi:hypothetical protein
MHNIAAILVVTGTVMFVIAVGLVFKFKADKMKGR